MGVKRVQKKSGLIFIIIITLTLTSGCWGRIEVDQASVLVGSGWDRTANGRIVVTIQSALAQPGDTDQSFTTVTAVGDTVSAALRNTSLLIPRKQLPHHIIVSYSERRYGRTPD